MSVNFAEILNKKEEDLPKPKPRPAGTYLCQVVGLPSQEVVVSKKDGTEMGVVKYKVKPISALEDVDTDELRSHPPIHEWGQLNRSIDFFIHTEGGQYYHHKWLGDTLGIDDPDKTTGERMAEAPGKQLLVKLKHMPFVNRQGEPDIGIEIESTAHV